MRSYITSTGMVTIKTQVIRFGEDVEKVLVGMWKGTAALRTSLTVSQNIKHRVTTRTNNSTPRHIFKKNDATTE